MRYDIKYKTLDYCKEHAAGMYFFSMVVSIYKSQDDDLRWSLLSEMDEDAL